MAMDFFESQDEARKNTGRLVILFILAVLAIIVAIYLLVNGLIMYAMVQGMASDQLQEQQRGLFYWDLDIVLMVTAATLLIVAGGSLFKIIQLRAGGTAIAESLGGRRIYPDTTDPVERKVINVVEEMAIASGTPAPPVFLLDHEQGINAFAAGFTPADAVIGVTAGTATKLTRDELQGVIAHEFSHILNGDMRLNIRLIGVLHGILIIGILGYFILRSSFYSSGRSSSSRRGNPLPVILLGGGLMVIGYVGTFFGKLIKAAVSRQREYLADAAAVQFTRNPDGIAGALKKIGGFTHGSKIQNPNAPQASHMFFGEGALSRYVGIFATHPPLQDRIARIDPSWPGEFPDTDSMADPAAFAERPPSAMQTRMAASGAAVGVSGLAGSASRSQQQPQPQAQHRPQPQSPAPTDHTHVSAQEIDDAFDHIGRPNQAHIAYAAEIVQSLPQQIVSAAREPYGARALIYALLMDRDPEILRIQAEQLARHANPDVFDKTQKLLPQVQQLHPRVRLPLIDMTIPALRCLSPDQYFDFERNVVELVKADRIINVFEWTLQRILLHHVRSQYTRVRPPRVKHRGLDKVRPQVQVLLSALAYAGGTDPAQARSAFDQAAASLQLPGLSIEPWERAHLNALDAALDQLNQTAPRLKKQLLHACAACITADRQVTVAEAEVLRAIADSLGAPMPPFLPGQPLD